MRYSEKGESLQGKGNGFFGWDYQSGRFQDEEMETFELSQEFSPSKADVRKWKKHLSRS